MTKHLEILRSFIGKAFTASPSPFMRWLNPIIESVGHEYLEFRYTVRQEWLNPMGTLHGGVSAAIIDDIIGATLMCLDDPRIYITINNTIDYFAPAREGEDIIAKSYIVKKGKEIVNAGCEIWNADRTRLLAKGASNLLSKEIGNRKTLD